MHYFKFNIPDWALHTAHLTPEEEGVYLRLINHYYDTEEGFEIDKTERVIRRLRLGSCSVIVGLILDEFFYQKDGEWRHKRCQEEVNAYRKKAETNKVNGKNGGRPPVKPIKKQKVSSAGNPQITQSVKSGNPKETLTINQEPRTKNQEPLTKNQRKKRNTKEKIDKFKEWPGVPNKQHFDDWMDSRKKKKAAFTQTAFNGLGKRLTAGVNMGLDFDDMVLFAAEKGYAGFNVEWYLNEHPEKRQSITLTAGEFSRPDPGGNKKQPEIIGEVECPDDM